MKSVRDRVFSSAAVAGRVPRARRASMPNTPSVVSGIRLRGRSRNRVGNRGQCDLASLLHGDRKTIRRVAGLKYAIHNEVLVLVLPAPPVHRWFGPLLVTPSSRGE